jgi:hypothetical protein
MAADNTINPKTGKRYTPEEFTLMAIVKLQKPPYKGIHSLYSGFKDAYVKFFPGRNVDADIDDMARRGIIDTRPSKKGGPTMYVGGQDPNKARLNNTLATILGE